MFPSRFSGLVIQGFQGDLLASFIGVVTQMSSFRGVLSCFFLRQIAFLFIGLLGSISYVFVLVGIRSVRVHIVKYCGF